MNPILIESSVTPWAFVVAAPLTPDDASAPIVSPTATTASQRVRNEDIGTPDAESCLHECRATLAHRDGACWAGAQHADQQPDQRVPGMAPVGQLSSAPRAVERSGRRLRSAGWRSMSDVGEAMVRCTRCTRAPR